MSSNQIETFNKNDIVLNNLQEIFSKRVEWHFDVASEQVIAQYTKLPEEVFDVLVAPPTRDKKSKNKFDSFSSFDLKETQKSKKKK